MNAVRFVVATAGWRRTREVDQRLGRAGLDAEEDAGERRPPGIRPTLAGDPQPQSSASETPRRIAASAADSSAAPSQSIRGRWPAAAAG